MKKQTLIFGILAAASVSMAGPNPLITLPLAFESYNSVTKKFAGPSGFTDASVSQFVFSDGTTPQFSLQVNAWDAAKVNGKFVDFNQNNATVTGKLESTLIRLKQDKNELGLGAQNKGTNSGDQELRNNLTSGLQLLELSNLTVTPGYAIKNFTLKVTSVDKNEGFLVYGSNSGPDVNGNVTLTKLFHDTNSVNGFSPTVDLTSYLKQYKDFWVTADNGSASSVILSNGTSAMVQAVPEPSAFAVLGLGLVGLVVRRRKS